MPMKLYPHQQQSLDNTKDFNRVAYYLDMADLRDAKMQHADLRYANLQGADLD